MPGIWIGAHDGRAWPSSLIPFSLIHLSQVPLTNGSNINFRKYRRPSLSVFIITSVLGHRAPSTAYEFIKDCFTSQYLQSCSTPHQTCIDHNIGKIWQHARKTLRELGYTLMFSMHYELLYVWWHLKIVLVYEYIPNFKERDNKPKPGHDWNGGLTVGITRSISREIACKLSST